MLVLYMRNLRSVGKLLVQVPDSVLSILLYIVDNLMAYIQTPVAKIQLVLVITICQFLTLSVRSILYIIPFSNIYSIPVARYL
jgi:hypothetical protein